MCCELQIARTKENKFFGHFLNVVSFNIQMHMTEQQQRLLFVNNINSAVSKIGLDL